MAQPQRPRDGHRTIPAITAELAEVDRHLREMPPHHGGGSGDLSARADALRRELAAARAAHDRAGAARDRARRGASATSDDEDRRE